MVRVLLVDDHPIVRAGLRWVLEAQEDLYVVGEAAEGEEALRLAERLRPDVVLLDCRLPGRMDGMVVAQALRERCPAARVVALSAYADERLVWGMLEAGAAGYVLKDEPVEVILAAVRAAARGDACFRAEQVMTAWRWRAEVVQKWKRLTEREREVLRLLAAGKSNKSLPSTSYRKLGACCCLYGLRHSPRGNKARPIHTTERSAYNRSVSSLGVGLLRTGGPVQVLDCYLVKERGPR